MNSVSSIAKGLAVGAILVSLILLPFEGAIAGKDTAEKIKNVESRRQVKLIKKETLQKKGKAVDKKKIMENTLDKGKESKEENRMSSDMTKKGAVHIKGDKLLKLRRQDTVKKNEALLKKGEIKIEKQPLPNESSMEKKTLEVPYAGAVLAGTSAKLLDFVKADYDEVIKSDKLVALYFYANSCPVCKEEFPKMQEVFAGLTSDKVIGFRVNYNDNETDDAERALAREFGVAYQHTKVLIKNGKRILKSPEGWDTNRYSSQINKYLAQ